MSDLTEEIAMSLIGRLKLSGPIPMRIDLHNVCGYLNLRLTMDVPDRDTGVPSKVVMVRDIPYHMREVDPDTQARLLLDMAYDMVRDAYIHEAEECFTVGGLRINDPHLEGQSVSRASMYETAASDLLASVLSPRK